MTIHHVAIWTKNIERMSDFYERYFNAIKGKKYENHYDRFSSYFLKFRDGSNLEIMQMDNIPDNKNDAAKQYIGIIHIAISVGTKENVDQKTNELKKDGYFIISEPKWTGDGYYESCIYDPDMNRIEITI